MMYKLLLDGHRAPWKHHKDTKLSLYVQGTLVFKGTFISDLHPLLTYLHAQDLGQLQWIDELVDKFDGFGNIIIVTHKHLVIIRDRINTFPLFFSRADTMTVADDCDHLAQICRANGQNNDAVLEYLFGGYVIGENMLFLGMQQCQAGHYYIVDLESGALSKKNYFSYYPIAKRTISADDSTDLSLELRSLLHESFARFGRYVTENGLIPVVPLSGGMDSRLIAVMLKEVGMNNTVCYTFGTSNHEEVNRSRSVAEGLGFKWLFCPYTTSKWHDLFSSTEMDRFLRFTNPYAARPHITEMLAVKELFRDDRDYVFIPGHTLDLLAGYHIPRRVFAQETHLTCDTLVSCIMAKQYNSFSFRKPEETFFMNRLSMYCSKTEYRTPEELTADFERWNWLERQSKFIMSAVDVYSFYGHAWYTPFWEREYMSFFLRIPYRSNFNRHLLKTMLHGLFPAFYEEPPERAAAPSRGRRVNPIGKLMQRQVTPAFLRNAARRARHLLFSTKFKVYDYGLNHHGCFEAKEQTIHEYLGRLRRRYNIRSLHYLFHLHFLQRMGIDLHHLHRSYLVLEPFPPVDER